MVRLSISIPTYNRASMLPATLRTILNQSYDNFEVVIVDNASTDGTERVVRSIRDARIRYVRNRFKLDLPQSKNRAIEESRGEFIAIYHDHDFYHPDIVRRSIQIFDDHPNVGVVFTAAHVVHALDPSRIITTARMKLPQVVAGEYIRRELLHQWDCSIVAGTTMVRRACYERVGLMRQELGAAADRDLWLRIFRYWDLGYIPETMARLRQVLPITRFDSMQAAQHWNNLICHMEVQRIHADYEFRNNLLRRSFEGVRLKAKHFREFWKRACWMLTEREQSEFARAALEAFRATGMGTSAAFVEALQASNLAASALTRISYVHRAMFPEASTGRPNPPPWNLLGEDTCCRQIDAPATHDVLVHERPGAVQ